MLSAEGRELFEAMQKHEELRCLSMRFADKLAGEAMSSGQSLDSMRTAMGDAATELAAMLEGGVDVPPQKRASLVRRYVAQARRRTELPGYGGRMDSRREAERDPTPEEIRALYPLVQLPEKPFKPGEKMVPPEQVNALLASLMKNAGRGGVPVKASIPDVEPETTATSKP